jgi:hypothetical protein
VTTFIAIDGEADDQGRYIVMCDSLGRELINPEGVTTKQALEWLLDLAPGGPCNPGKAKLVCFGLNYDVNQWLRDCSAGELTRIAYEGKTSHRMRYRLSWLPRKLFTVKDAKTGRRVVIAEVFGFFQTTFVKALKQWGLEPTAEIESMKRARGTFTHDQLKQIAHYCHAECTLLVELMGRLAEACEHAGCVPAKEWIGAGAIASRLLTVNQVKLFHAYDADLAARDIVESHILGAYFGGRVEMLAQGVTPIARTVDIKSAYPAAAMHLPNLLGAKLVPLKHYQPDAEHAIWRVSWDGQNHNGVCPFPVRLEDFTIVYPESGAGHYHAAEVRAAIDVGYRLTVHDGVKLRQPGGALARERVPFAFIPQLFAIRDQYKVEGHAAEKALKLGLNSVYGKLAQGYGYGNSPPPFQSYMWAGEITARTRAIMLRCMHQVNTPLMVSTDGLFYADANRVAPAAVGVPRKGLGSLDYGEMTDPLLVQAGVYSYNCPACRPRVGYQDPDPACERCDGRGYAVKSRGFAARDVDYGELREMWLDDGPAGTYHYRSRRFIGLRVALARNKLATIWRTWPTEARSLNLTASRKLTPEHGGRLLRLEPLTGPYDSMPYVPKQSLYDDPTDDTLEMMTADDQPHCDIA